MSDAPVILLIDGIEDDCRYFIQRLEICCPELEIIRAATGHMALDLCRQHSFDCVVLELALPDISGFEVLVTLVPRVWHPDTAVVVLTGIANRYVWNAALKNGAQAAFYKPMTSGDILYQGILKAMSVVRKDRKRTSAFGCGAPLMLTDRITVLLVDDYPAMRQLLREVLQRHSDIHVIGEAATGEEAVAQHAKFHPTVVLIDIQLPTMSGIEATTFIKHHNPSTTIIGLTAGASDSTEAAMREAGAATVLSKDQIMSRLYPAIIEEAMLSKISAHLR